MKKQKIFRSRPSVRFLILALVVTSLALLMIHFGWKNFHIRDWVIRATALVPILVGVMLLSLVLKMGFDCFGKEVLVSPESVTLKKGSWRKSIRWRELREIKLRRLRFGVTLSSSFYLEDGTGRFEINDITFPDFHFLLEVVRIAQESVRQSGYSL